ncbi:hypothetical protein C8034_v010912 [Colletotrichum sidae]|uniref:Uncharacterized protein n=1 Tax=Colletotrichum sidae TaxID=1347389 RepID=A0A4R8TJ89_9PEZI|nr:hypothetical protein C8034_v010912 [Colletotrichum sidae]
MKFLPLLVLISTASSLPATPAIPTLPPTPLPHPFLSSPSSNANPAPSPIYSLLPIPSNSSLSNSTFPCASGRPLRLGPARLHKQHPPQRSSPTTLPVALATTPPTAAAEAAALAVSTPPAGPPDYASILPAAPDVTPRPEPNLAEMGYYQTTYYSCATRDATVHCGWHRPLRALPASSSSPSSSIRAGSAFVFAILLNICFFLLVE